MQSDDQDRVLLDMFVEETEDALKDIDAVLVMLEHSDSAESVEQAMRVFHTIKGNSRYVELPDVEKLCHELETAVEALSGGHMDRGEVVNVLLLGADALRGMCQRLREYCREAFEAEALDSLLAQIKHVCTPVSERMGALWLAAESLLKDLSDSASPTQLEMVGGLENVFEQLRALHSVVPKDIGVPVVDSPRRAPVESVYASAQGARMMRVEEAKIDEFLDFVGELIVTREMFTSVTGRLVAGAEIRDVQRRLREAVGSFSTLSRDLQRSIMAIRRVPVSQVLTKVPRIVREIAATERKSIRIDLDDTGVELDKSVVEALEGPLTHLIRNACDHGIEDPDTRIAKGKPPEGVVAIDVVEDASTVTLSIVDDGGGIDATRVLEKAIRANVVTPQSASRLVGSEVLDLIFAPGLSTADTVNQYSGRGVGMNVVKQNIEKIGGSLTVSSELGVGTSIEIVVPKSVSVQIVEGLLVRSCAQTFVLPLGSIGESFELHQSEIRAVTGSDRVIVRGERVIPLVDLHSALGLAPTSEAVDSRIGVTVESGGVTYGLGVHEVLGIQQVVVRDMVGIVESTEDFPCAGAAILGDGNVVMVLAPEVMMTDVRAEAR